MTGAPSAVERREQLADVHVALTPEAEEAQSQHVGNVREAITNDV